MSDKQQEAFQTFEFDLQPIRGFPELRWTGKKSNASTTYFPAQKKESYGDSVDGWINKIFWGDNFQVMSHLLRDFRGKIDLIYIDPPFDSRADYKKKITVRNSETSSDYGAFEEKQYTDIWASENYMQFIYDRLLVIRELLSEKGIVCVHLDHSRVHNIKCILDEVFMPDRFINEIIWHYRTFQGQTRGYFARKHDNILVYSKSNEFSFEQLFQTDFADTIDAKRWKNFFREDGCIYGDNMPEHDSRFVRYLNKWKRNNPDKSPAESDIIYAAKGQPLDSVWDLKGLDPKSNEKTGYPTQKPVQLLEMIIRAFSEPGNIVADFFMGSGTTLVAASRLGRKYIGADINLGSIETTMSRLAKATTTSSPEALDLEQKSIAGFELFNVNNYDIFRNPVEAKELIKEAMELQPLPTSSVFDGQRDQYLVKIMPVNRIATRADLNEVINGMDFKAFERRQAEAPSKIVERIMLVCMGHEPDLGPELVKAAKPFNIEVEVVDLIRDKSNLHFKRQSEAKLAIKDGYLEIAGFYPLNLLQKLSMDTDTVEDWRQLVETVKIDWNYDGAVLSPELIDAPGKDELVSGRYPVPKDAATIRVKITDLLSESWEGEIENG